MPKFISLVDSSGTMQFINMDQITCIDQIRDGHCRVHFVGKSIIEIEGPGATQLVAVVTQHSCDVISYLPNLPDHTLDAVAKDMGVVE